MQQPTPPSATLHSQFPTSQGQMPPGMGQPQPGQASLAAVLWRRKGLVLFFLLCGVAGGYVFFTQQPETYQAGAIVEVFRRQTQTGTDSAVERVVDMAPTVAFIQAEITGDEVLRSAVEIGQLTAFEKTPADPAAMVGVIRQNLQVLPAIEGAESGDRSIVQVIFESEDPSVATAVVNSVVQAYEEYVNGRHRNAVEDVVGFFREGRDSVMPKLEELEKKYTEFRATAPLEWSSNGEAVNPFREDAIRLEEMLQQLEMDSRQLSSKLKLIEETSKGAESAVAVLREVQFLLDDVHGVEEMKDALVNATDEDLAIQEKLVSLRIRADLLASQFAANHPQRQAVEQQLAATQKALQDIAAQRAARAPEQVDPEQRQEEAAKSILRNYISGMRKKQQLIGEDIQDITQRLDQVREKALQLIAFENENASFLRQIGRYQSMLDSFDSQLERANLPTLNSGLELHVLRPAGLGALVGPLLARCLLIGGFIGAVIGGAIGFLVDWSERTFRNPDDVASTLDLAILAHLPLMLVRRKKKRSGDKAGPYDKIDPMISVLHDPHSPGAEAIRSIRTSLFSTATHEAEYRVVQITSALPGDGKSTIVANLAASVAGANKRVIIVDADLRRPTQESLFGVEAELGLTSVLNGDCALSDALVATPVEGLYILPTGPKPSNPAEALMLPEFGQMLDDLRSEFDLVLVDTPPLLSVTDASNVATNVDGVMFVMRIGRNAKPMAKRATTILRALHVNIIGVIVNAVGDSGYSATYANAWSTSYGGQPGAEYGYGYHRYGSDRYLNASKGQGMTVRGKSELGERRRLVGTAAPGEGVLNGHASRDED